MENMERMFKPSEVAKMLNIDRHTVTRWIREGRIKAVKLPSGRYRIPESEVRKILEGGGG